MDLTLDETMAMLGVSRSQVSRYAADGRLVRTGQGRYDAASIGNIDRPYRQPRNDLLRESDLRAIISRQRALFRGQLAAIVAKRPGWAGMTPALSRGLSRAADGYTDLWAKRAILWSMF